MDGGENTGALKAPWRPGQSGNPGGRPKTPKHLRKSSRELVDKVLSEFRRRPIDQYSFDELKQMLVIVAPWAGMVNADVAWQAAMATLANANLTADQRSRLIEMLGGEDEKPQDEQALLAEKEEE